MVKGVSSGGDLTARRRLARLAAAPPGAAVLLACAAVLALRRAQAVTVPQFWAEDGYFFERAYELGWRAFLEPFAGYLHTMMRVIAGFAVAVDPARAPALFVASSAAVTLYVALRTLSPRCPLPKLGGACALAVVLVPDTYEVLLTVVNLQWVMGAGMVLLLISGDPRGARQWAHDLAAAALTGLTGPLLDRACAPLRLAGLEPADAGEPGAGGGRGRVRARPGMPRAHGPRDRRRRPGGIRGLPAPRSSIESLSTLMSAKSHVDR
jgi:hypothetical protein